MSLGTDPARDARYQASVLLDFSHRSWYVHHINGRTAPAAKADEVA
jgi:hypothetical protein